MPSLELHAEKAQRIIKNGFRQHPMERDIIVLWGMYRGWGTTTVKKVRDRFCNNPSEIFRNPVLSGILRAGKVVWKCEVCGIPMPGTEPVNSYGYMFVSVRVDANNDLGSR